MTFVIVTSMLVLSLNKVIAYDMRLPFYNARPLNPGAVPITNLALQRRLTVVKKPCYVFGECQRHPMESIGINMLNGDNIQSSPRLDTQDSNLARRRTAQNTSSIDEFPSRRMLDQRSNSNTIPLTLNGNLNGYPHKRVDESINNKLNMKLDSLTTKRQFVQTTTAQPSNTLWSTTSSKENTKSIEISTKPINIENPVVTNSSRDLLVYEKFIQSLESFDRKFYTTTFTKLTSISPPARRENGMSFVQSGLFLHLALMSLSTEVDLETRHQIDDCLGIDFSDQERLALINETVSSLPASSEALKFRWSSRLVLRNQTLSHQFRAGAAAALRLKIDSFNGSETTKEMTDALNNMVEADSGGAIHNTFEEEEVSASTRAVLVSTLYLRARWRSAPTLLNGTRPFRDAGAALGAAASASGAPGATRMIRVNDNMRYAWLHQWDAEALEIFYSTPGLSLLVLVPRGTSLRRLAAAVANTSLDEILRQMNPLRVAATMPLYTLRMTLLLPNKLQAMNISRLVEADNSAAGEFRLSLAVQRIMFWAEAGRNAFKDDGIEWDEKPQREVVVDRPYIFYVRWKNKTIMNGNFVL